MRPVHPRGCGEYAVLPVFHQRSVRFIPADAGNTARHRRAHTKKAVHPRGCGEYINSRYLPVVRHGSSPRMRGIRQRHGWRIDAAAVHPRGCGEYISPVSGVNTYAGSSPRMRGIRAVVRTGTMTYRFIPADAGNTLRKTLPAPYAPVHPRGCGEYCLQPSHGGRCSGSSPRMRGILSIEAIPAGYLRFIPADAGNTHPGRFLSLQIDGSSPRMRGIRGAGNDGQKKHRFIPADAGNTSLKGVSHPIPSVHPRGCGEYACRG